MKKENKQGVFLMLVFLVIILLVLKVVTVGAADMGIGVGSLTVVSPDNGDNNDELYNDTHNTKDNYENSNKDNSGATFRLITTNVISNTNDEIVDQNSGPIYLGKSNVLIDKNFSSESFNEVHARMALIISLFILIVLLIILLVLGSGEKEFIDEKDEEENISYYE